MSRTEPLPGPLEPRGRTIGAEERAAVLRVLDSASLCGSFGTEARALEAEMGELYGRTAVSCSSGTAALHLAVAAVDPDPGDEIVTTPISDFGTVAPILAQNAVPVFADVDPATGNLDPASVAAVITARTRAIMVVHLFGAPAPVAELRGLADRHGLALVEDCAQAWLGTVPSGEPVGRYGDVACFSLQQYKHITSGDGGLAITADPALARRMRLFMDKGWDRSIGRKHLMYGLNYRMTELAAAVARAQLGKVAGVVARRRERAARLLDALADLPGLGLPSPDGHAWWMFPFTVPDEPGNRAFAAALQAEGVPASAGYLERPLYANPALAEAPVYGSSRYPIDRDYPAGLCPNAERLIDRTLVTLPWNEAYTEADVDDIAAAVRKAHADVR
ncbi:DegT/DnrJ/EryC1/StrS family aminotransferase [Actinomadura atramentaria]|uniref:DegT/DnrJ/EryC1/StrS family aminotransferase n=1 Tax=Actinomadura atramentaria TaxID=1990 RepID=UPI000380F196|nr:DegT/DnrJ/EryC1/StrS family aminotransferase [Actinomadura atramentaria]